MRNQSPPVDQNSAPEHIWSVSELNNQARNCLENNFSGIQVEGEISDLIQHRSGHWYFTLKDEDGQLRSAMFKFQNRSVRFNPENGQQVLLTGKLSLYAPRGSYQFIAERMAPAGLGQLQKQFEDLKIALQQRGLFDHAKKQPLPPFPRQVAIITSPQGAAIRDIQTTFARRFSGIALFVVPVAVQGEGSSQAIADAIDDINVWAKDGESAEFNPDAIIVGRGGGSLEDLWAFNEQAVAEAIYRSKLPIISAVGHETDITIADFVADVRAATPTAAAEMLSPDRSALASRVNDLFNRLKSTMANQLRHADLRLNALSSRVKHPSFQLTQSAQRLDQLDLDMQRAMRSRLDLAQQKLNQLIQRLQFNSPANQISKQQLQLEQLYQRSLRAINSQLSERQQHWRRLAETLNVVSPLATLKRGYSIVSDQRNTIVRTANDIEIGDTINARLGEGSISCKVLEKA